MDHAGVGAGQEPSAGHGHSLDGSLDLDGGQFLARGVPEGVKDGDEVSIVPAIAGGM